MGAKVLPKKKKAVDVAGGASIAQEVRVLWSGLDTVNLTMPLAETRRYCLDVLALLGDEDELVTVYNGQQVLLKRGGAGGYSCSIWRGDVRFYFARREIQGIWVQVGSSTCSRGSEAVVAAVESFVVQVLGLDNPEMEYRLTRLDLAVDVASPMVLVEDIEAGWVGRSRKLAEFGEVLDKDSPISSYSVYRSRKDREWRAETVYLGSRSSAIQLRVYNKKLKYDASDLSAWGLTEDTLPESITRWEWQVRCRDAGFEFSLYDLDEALLVGMVEKLRSWGRLAVPSETDSDHRRWELHPVFAAVVGALVGLSESSMELVRHGRGVAQVLGSGMSWASSILAGIVARLTEPGRADLTVADALEVLERQLIDGTVREREFLEKYNRRYEKFSVLAAVG